MNQPPSAPVAPKTPLIAPWLLILFIIVLLGGGGYLIWNYLGQQKTQPSETTETAVPEEAIETPTEPTTEPTDTTATADWKTYTDTNTGFNFKYPANAIKDAGSKDSKGLTFSVSVANINTMTDAPLGYDKVNAAKDKTALSNNDPSTVFGMAVQNSYQLLNITGAVGKKLTILRQLDVCDLQFTREAIIYKGDNQIIITWKYNGTDIVNNNPSYFKTDSTNCGTQEIWKDPNTFYTDIVAGKTDSVSKNWFNTFDTILSTFQFSQ